MKKVILPLILLMLGAALFALESAPSDVVGFVKVTCNAGYTPFALPFTQFNTSGVETLALVDIVAPYMTGGTALSADRIMDIGTGSVAYKTGAGAISGFQNFTIGHGYYMHNRHSAFNLYLAGTVVPTVINFGTMGIGFNVVGIKEASAVPMSSLDLVSCGFTGGTALTSDKVWDMNNGQTATYNTSTSTWAGTLTALTPGHVYYVQVKNNHTAFNWTYDPTSRNAAPVDTRHNHIDNNR